MDGKDPTIGPSTITYYFSGCVLSGSWNYTESLYSALDVIRSI